MGMQNSTPVTLGACASHMNATDTAATGSAIGVWWLVE